MKAIQKNYTGPYDLGNLTGELLFPVNKEEFEFLGE